MHVECDPASTADIGLVRRAAGQLLSPLILGPGAGGCFGQVSSSTPRCTPMNQTAFDSARRALRPTLMLAGVGRCVVGLGLRRYSQRL